MGGMCFSCMHVSFLCVFYACVVMDIVVVLCHCVGVDDIALLR